MLSSRVTPHLDVPLPHHCPVTGLPVFSHSSWTYTSPGGGYRLRVSFIGDRILWLQPSGYVLRRHAQKGMALVEDVLFTMLPEKSAFIAIDDFSAVTGATLDARRFIIRTLRRQQRLKAYIVYQPTTIFRLGFELSRQIGLFHFDVRVAADYAEAIAIAQARLRQMVPSVDAQETTSETPPYDADTAPAVHRSGGAAPLARYAGELLEYVGNINLETYGFSSTFRKIPRNHPFRSVFDALSMLRDDMRAILDRHRKARENLEVRQKELIEKQMMLSETHITLSLLLTAREKERQRLEARIIELEEEIARVFGVGVDLADEQLTEREESPFRTVGELVRYVRELMEDFPVNRRFDVRFLPVEAAGVPCEWVLPPGVDPRRRVL